MGEKGHKIPVELEDIFRKCPKQGHRIVLIEGAPGIGKSSLIIHICHKWETGELFSQFQWVVRVLLRDPAVQSATCLTDILPHLTKDDAFAVAAEIEKLFGENCLFLCDGFDEYPRSKSRHLKSFIEKLIENPAEINLGKSTVVVTSRPVASGELRASVNARIEIMGFGEKEIHAYIQTALSYDPKKVEEILDHFVKYPVIQGLCYIPLNSAFLVDISRTHSKSLSLPQTLLGMFSEMIICNIVKENKKNPNGIELAGEELSSLGDILKKPIKDAFMTLCKLAYEGVIKNVATFRQKDLRDMNITSLESMFGLMHAVQSSTQRSKEISYSFSHMSIQETLAAFFISNLSPKKQLEIFKSLLGNPRLSPVLYMFAGFTKLDNPYIRDLLSSMSLASSESKHLLISVVNALYEARDVSFYRFLSSLLDGSFNLEDTSLTPADCLSVGYLLSCVKTRNFSVNLSSCSLSDAGVNMVCREMEESSNICISSLK